jgi:hypothetical protein
VALHLRSVQSISHPTVVRNWHVGYQNPGCDDQNGRRRAIVIMYIWTAPGTGAAGFLRATGVSDDQNRARAAAEAALRTSHADTAYLERVYTAVAAPALSLCYIRTGTGWKARLGHAGRVEWTPFTAPVETLSAEMTVPPEPIVHGIPMPAEPLPAESALTGMAVGDRQGCRQPIREDADA